MNNTNIIRAALLAAVSLAAALSLSCIPKQYAVTRNYDETAYRDETTSETYTENQTRTETVSGEYALDPLYSWYSQEIVLKDLSNVRYMAYEIPQYPPYDSISLKVSVWKQLQYEAASLRVLDMTGPGHLTAPTYVSEQDTSEGLFKWTWITPSGQITSWTWLDEANRKMAQSVFLGGRSYIWSKQEDPQILELYAGNAKKVAIIICGAQNAWNSRISLSVTWSRSNATTEVVAKVRSVTKKVPYTVTRQKTIYETRQVPFWEALLTP